MILVSPALALASLAPIELPPPAPADLERRLVPADTPFLVHVDVDAFLETRLAEVLLEVAGDELDLDGMGLDEIEAEFGVHPFKDLRSVTVFSATGDADGGVAIVRTSARLDDLLARLSQEEEYHLVQKGGLTLHSFDDEALAHVVNVDDERLVVISDDLEQVLGAAQVLYGRRESLAKADEPALRARPMHGAFLYVEVGEALGELVDDSPASHVGQLARRLTVQLGESEGRTFLRAEVEAADGEAAGNIAGVLTGALSLARLAGGDELPPFVVELLDDIDVTQNGTSVRVEIDFDARSLAEQIAALADEF